MGSVITVMNMKGGVGKTTVAMHLAGVISQYEMTKKPPRRVLVIDYDPQFNLSQAFIPAKEYFKLEKDRKTTLSILVDDENDLNPYQLQVPGNLNPPRVSAIAHRIYNSANHKGVLDVIPSTLDLMYVALGHATSSIKPIEERFRKFVDEAKTLYDVILIDCHPAGSIFTQTSLKNSDHVLIPVIPQRFSVRGVGLMMEFINAKAVGSAKPSAHILFNHVQRRGVALEEASIRNEKRFADLCLKQTLKKFKLLSEPEGGKGFAWHSGKPYSGAARQNLYAVASELTTRVGV